MRFIELNDDLETGKEFKIKFDKYQIIFTLIKEEKEPVLKLVKSK